MAGFRKAERKKAKLRLALSGTSGSGKTYSSLLLAKGIGGKVALIDTENGSGELYADLFNYDVMLIAPEFTVEKYINAIDEAEKADYDVLIIDSLSPAWNGIGGLLDLQKRLAASKYRGNSFAAWKDVTPLQEKLVQAIVQSNIHIIATMRSKTEYVQTDDKKIKKVGTAPIQRDGIEYEFTTMFDIDQDTHLASATKDRTNLFDGRPLVLNEKTGELIKNWLEKGEETTEIIINDVQRRELYGMFMNAKMKEHEMRDYILMITGKENSKDLTTEEFKEVFSSLEVILQNQENQKQKEVV